MGSADGAWGNIAPFRGVELSKRPDWSRPLAQQIVIPDLMTLRTLADVRVLLNHLPEKYRVKATWRHVAKTLDEAAAGGIHPIEIPAS